MRSARSRASRGRSGMGTRRTGSAVISRCVTRAVSRSAIAGGPGNDGRVAAAAPFAPGTVIETMVVVTERLQRKGDRGRRHAGAAGGDDRLVQIDSRAGEQRPEL